MHITMEMGGFSPVGIAEVPAICPDAEELNGLPINRVGPRILHLVRDDSVTSLFWTLSEQCPD